MFRRTQVPDLAMAPPPVTMALYRIIRTRRRLAAMIEAGLRRDRDPAQRRPVKENDPR